MIHPTAVIGEPPESRDVRHEGTGIAPIIASTATIEALCTVDAGKERPTTIADKAWLMKGCHVGHDAQIGPNCELAPHTVIGGFAVLEEGVRCGVGVLVLPRRRIGRGARLGAGAVVTKDVPAGETWVGNPARRLERPAPVVFTRSEEQGWEELALASGIRPEWVEWWHEKEAQKRRAA